MAMPLFSPCEPPYIRYTLHHASRTLANSRSMGVRLPLEPIPKSYTVHYDMISMMSRVDMACGADPERSTLFNHRQPHFHLAVGAPNDGSSGSPAISSRNGNHESLRIA